MAGDSNHYNDLMFACMLGDVEFLLDFIDRNREKKNFMLVDETGWSPIFYAIAGDSYECTEILLSSQLVDIRFEAEREYTCLDVAVDQEASCDIIRLLLECDPNFYFIRSFSEALEKAVKKHSLEMVETIVGTLQQMGFSKDDSCHYTYLVSHIVDSYLQSDAERPKLTKILEILIGFVFDESRSDFMQGICDIFLRHLYKDVKSLFEWSIRKWHLADTNKHRDLVKHLVENSDYRIDHYIIFCLHSGIFRIGSDKYEKTFYSKKVLDCLLEVNNADRHVISEVAHVMWQKIDMRNFNQVFWKTFLENLKTHGRQHIVDQLTSVEWLHDRRLSDKLDIGLMSFEYLSELEKVSPKLAKFCMEGEYRTNNTLKSLCREEIRKSLLQSEEARKTHLQLVKNVQTLGLPRSIQRFLLFNF